MEKKTCQNCIHRQDDVCRYYDLYTYDVSPDRVEEGHDVCFAKE